LLCGGIIGGKGRKINRQDSGEGVTKEVIAISLQPSGYGHSAEMGIKGATT